MAKMQYLDVAGLQRYDAGSVTRMTNAITAAKTEVKGYVDGLASNYDAAGTAQTKVDELANGQVKTNTEAITKLNGGSGVEGSVAYQIAAAKTELESKITASKYDDTQVKADIASNLAAINKLNGDVSTEGSVKYEVAAQIAEIVNENDNGSIDTLKEIAAWIGNHPDDAAAMNAKITANANAITALETLVGDLPESTTATTVVGYVDEQVAAAKTALTSDINAAKTDAINTAAADATEKANTAKSEAIAEAAAKDTALETSLKTYIDNADTTLGSRITAIEESVGTGGTVAADIAKAQQAADDAQADADKAQETADAAQEAVDALTERVVALEGLVGEGFEAIPNDTIDALFA